MPLIWHTSSLPCWVSGNFHHPWVICCSLFSYFACFVCFAAVSMCVWNLLTKSKLVQKRMKSVAYSFRGKANTNLARYRDVPDSQSTISTTLLLHGATFTEPCPFFFFFYKEIILDFFFSLLTLTLNASFNTPNNFFYQNGDKVKTLITVY